MRLSTGLSRAEFTLLARPRATSRATDSLYLFGSRLLGLHGCGLCGNRTKKNGQFRTVNSDNWRKNRLFTNVAGLKRFSIFSAAVVLDWALSGPIASGGRHQCQGSESFTPNSSLLLGSLARSFFVTLALVGIHFTVKRKIWCVRTFQILLFSPSTDKRVHHAKDEHQHASRNPEP